MCSVFLYCFVYFLLMYIVVSFLFVYSCTDYCRWVETQLRLHKSVIPYHIISYHIYIIYQVILHTRFLWQLLSTRRLSHHQTTNKKQ
jgi:hypothetical protein